jgi:Fe-S cluster assembly scaffold protein SufB
MSETSGAVVSVSVSVVGSQWVQHGSISQGTTAARVETTDDRLLFLNASVIRTEPSIAIGEPVPVNDFAASR